MSNHDEQDHNAQGHFDELDAVRRFPSEDTWLDQPMPDLQDGNDSGADSGSGGDRSTDSSFADRVMQARHDDLALDAQIAELDQALPTELLQQFGTPKPSDSFVSKTVQKVAQDRKQRWQEMLARHVAPEPSTEFVSRTLAALQDGGTSGKKTSENRQLPAPQDNSRRGQNWTVFGLLATAAAALLWVSLTGDIRHPLELRLADQASPAVAYASSTSPMSAILARVADDEEPFAMFDEPADGLWLVSNSDSEELR